MNGRCGSTSVKLVPPLVLMPILVSWGLPLRSRGQCVRHAYTRCGSNGSAVSAPRLWLLTDQVAPPSVVRNARSPPDA